MQFGKQSRALVDPRYNASMAQGEEKAELIQMSLRASLWLITTSHAASYKKKYIARPVPGTIYDDKVRIVTGSSPVPLVLQFDCVRLCPIGDPSDRVRLYYLWLRRSKIKLPFETEWK